MLTLLAHRAVSGHTMGARFDDFLTAFVENRRLAKRVTLVARDDVTKASWR